MKRLVAITNGDLEYIDVEINPLDGEDMIPLKELDSSDVKNYRCPECKYSPLTDKEGYLVCKNCGTAYKIFDEFACCIIYKKYTHFKKIYLYN